MAKTQKDYEAEGAELFNLDINRPALGPKLSWQQKAVLRGYDDARDGACRATAKPLHSPRNSFTEQDRAMLHGLTEYMPHGAAAHVVNLSQQARSDTSIKRMHRLAVKIQSICAKYSARHIR